MLGDFDTKQMFSGYVDELRIWDTIRTAEEIEAWRNLTLPGGVPQIAAWQVSQQGMV